MHISQFYNKNQFLIIDKGSTTLQSYNSTVCAVVNGDLILGRDWDYSQTTRKHVYLFIKEYARVIYTQLEWSTNKRAKIQELINTGVIKFDKDL